jgi:hypothetical protein
LVKFFAVALCLAGPLPLASQSVPSAVGCWRLTFGPWRPPAEADVRLELPLPDSVHLTALRRDSVYFHATRYANSARGFRSGLRDTIRAAWRPLTKDSLELWLPTHWSHGIRARLHVTPDSLRGRAAIYVDFDPYDTPYSTVRALPCSSSRSAVSRDTPR